ncbi:MAG TPA: hypothetical protein VN822_12505 [Candidatus Acidoferrales bacterium]|nr:hypothetical protein [Candidatus Acidoferrales bacterium]
MTTLRIAMPDTCSVNAMTHPAEFPDGPLALAAMKSGYFVRLPFTVLSEVIAKQSSHDRQHVMRACASLLRTGDCILPHHEILRLMVQRFEQGLPLDLNHVNLRMPEAEDAIRFDTFDDVLSAQERQENHDNEEIFDSCHRQIRAAQGDRIPKSLAAFVSATQAHGIFWTVAREIYSRAATVQATDAAVRKFYGECEPFRALMVALFAQVYNRTKPAGVPRMKAGRSDTFMATCLPLCDEFVTRDKSMLVCYREVVAAAGLNVIVRSFEEFTGQFWIARN